MDAAGGRRSMDGQIKEAASERRAGNQRQNTTQTQDAVSDKARQKKREQTWMKPYVEHDKNASFKRAGEMEIHAQCDCMVVRLYRWRFECEVQDTCYIIY